MTDRFGIFWQNATASKAKKTKSNGKRNDFSLINPYNPWIEDSVDALQLNPN